MEPQQYQELLGLVQRLLVEQTTAKEKLTQELNDYKHNLQMAQREIELLRDQLRRADALTAAKDALIVIQAENLNLLRGGLNRPN